MLMGYFLSDFVMILTLMSTVFAIFDSNQIMCQRFIDFKVHISRTNLSWSGYCIFFTVGVECSGSVSLCCRDS